MSAIGMRPVPTWKSTAAAPTPIRDGAIDPPSALRPWHEEQPLRNICRPSETRTLWEVFIVVSVADGVAPLAMENVVPTEMSATIMSEGAAQRWRR